MCSENMAKIALNAVRLPKFAAINGKSWSPSTTVVIDLRSIHTERVYVRVRPSTSVDARRRASTDADGRRRARCEWAFTAVFKTDVISRMRRELCGL